MNKPVTTKVVSTEFLLYETEDGQSRMDARMVDELRGDSVVANFATTAADGKSYEVDHCKRSWIHGGCLPEGVGL